MTLLPSLAPHHLASLHLTAYIGPGTGLSAVGAALALIVGLAVAFLAFLWYPIRRLRRRRRERAIRPPGERAPDPAETVRPRRP